MVLVFRANFFSNYGSEDLVLALPSFEFEGENIAVFLVNYLGFVSLPYAGVAL